jgi:hypothetical protein
MKLPAVRSVTNCEPNLIATSALLPPGVSSVACGRVEVQWGEDLVLGFKLPKGKKTSTFVAGTITNFHLKAKLEQLTEDQRKALPERAAPGGCGHQQGREGCQPEAGCQCSQSTR